MTQHTPHVIADVAGGDFVSVIEDGVMERASAEHAKIKMVQRQTFSDCNFVKPKPNRKPQFFLQN